MKTKKRFVCPKHGIECEIVFNRNGGGRFHSCDTCYGVGDRFTVEGHEPFKAYGNIAEEFGQLGVPQEIRILPTVREQRKISLQQEYESFLGSIQPEEELDFRVLKKLMEEYVHSLGPSYRKKTLDELRADLILLRQKVSFVVV